MTMVNRYIYLIFRVYLSSSGKKLAREGFLWIMELEENIVQ